MRIIGPSPAELAPAGIFVAFLLGENRDPNAGRTLARLADSEDPIPRAGAHLMRDSLSLDRALRLSRIRCAPATGRSGVAVSRSLASGLDHRLVDGTYLGLVDLLDLA